MVDMSAVELLRQLENRALAAGEAFPRAEHDTLQWRGLGFRVDGEFLVVEMSTVREVLPTPQVARVPGTKAWMLGLSGLRGALLPVADLGGFLGRPGAPLARNSRVLVIQDEHLLVGLQVEEVLGLQHFAAERLAAPGNEVPAWLRAWVVAESRTDDVLWRVVDLKALVRSAQFMQVAA